MKDINKILIANTGKTYSEVAETTGLTPDEVCRRDSQRRRDVFLRVEMYRIHKKSRRRSLSNSNYP